MPAVRLLAAAGALAALLAAAMPAPAAASETWWQPAGLAGKTVTRVAPAPGGGVVAVLDDGSAWRTSDGARFTPSPPPPPAAGSTAAGVGWTIRGGTVYANSAPDPGAPALGSYAHLIAAVGATPGAVIAVSDSGVVWRRKPSGRWDPSLLLLPSTLVTGVPEVTSLAAFSAPHVSTVVYLGTRGYGTLLSSDGGDDWVRADSGLPADVFGLAADSGSDPPAVWAATSGGLYVHRLQPLPSVPSYADRALLVKWALTVLVCIAATGAAAFALRRWTA